MRAVTVTEYNTPTVPPETGVLRQTRNLTTSNTPITHRDQPSYSHNNGEVILPETSTVPATAALPGSMSSAFLPPRSGNMDRNNAANLSSSYSTAVPNKSVAFSQSPSTLPLAASDAISSDIGTRSMPPQPILEKSSTRDTISSQPLDRFEGNIQEELSDMEYFRLLEELGLFTPGSHVSGLHHHLVEE